MANAILDALGYVGDALDKPGRAVRGLLGGRPEEAMAWMPFSDSLGVTDQANRTSGSELLRQLGMDAGDGLGGTLAGIGTELATDPLTWAGAGLGGLLGRKAGAAAVARGPNYGTTADDLLRQADAFGQGGEAAAGHIRALNEANPRVFSEVAPGSKLIGVGSEGLAVRPEGGGDVLRLGMQQADQPGRAVSDLLAQPSRTADYAGGAGGQVARAERVPFAENVGDVRYWNSPAAPGGGPSRWRNPNRLDALIENVERSGHNAVDMKFKNVGTHAGRDVIIDPGSFLAAEGSHDFNPVVRAGDPSALMSRLLDMLGSDDAIRAGLTPSYTGQFARTGGAGGATLGGMGRLNQQERL